jgi:O-antigen/teichoic acid export membrane protein
MPEEETTESREQRFGKEGSLRVRTARGTIINGLFLTMVNGLAMTRGFVVAAFLTTAEYGVWGTLVAVVATLQILKQVGIGDKYVQQDDSDQRLAFQLAWTFEICVGVVFAALGAGLVVIASHAYGTPEIVAPGLVLLIAFPVQSLQFPLMWFYRRMEFTRQRTLQAFDPIVAFVVTIGLAIAGAGYWAIVVGTVVGSVSAAIAALIYRPYPLRWRFDRGRVREYVGFSGPLFVSGLAAVVTANGLVAAGEATVGLAGLGIIAVCAQVSQFADRAGRAITDTMYPAIAAVKDRADLLLEAFITSNRLALMWAVPFGAGVAIFSEDLLTRVLGSEWSPGVELLQGTAIALAIHHIGFNWTAFYRARGETGPIGIAGAVGIVTFLAVVLPLLLTEGLQGLAIGVCAAELVQTPMRLLFLRRIFPAFKALRYLARAVVPSILPVLAVLGLRTITEQDDRDLLVAAGEALLYLAMTIGCTWALEKSLLREVVGYVRGKAPVPVAAEISPG